MGLQYFDTQENATSWYNQLADDLKYELLLSRLDAASGSPVWAPPTPG